MKATVIPFKTASQQPGDGDMSFVNVLRADARQLHADYWRYRHTHESAIVLGVEPGISVADLSAAKKLQAQATCVSTIDKAAALAAYMAKTGNCVTPLILKRGRYVARLDGISADHRLVMSIQCEEDDDGFDLQEKLSAGVIPEHYLIRLQHMMAVADAQAAHLWLFRGAKYRNKYGILATVERNEGDFARIFTRWDSFQQHLDGNVPWTLRITQ